MGIIFSLLTPEGQSIEKTEEQAELGCKAYGHKYKKKYLKKVGENHYVYNSEAKQ